MSQQPPAHTMYVNKVTLTFIGRHAHMEAPFRDYLFNSHLRGLRIGIIVAIILLAFFGLYDAVQVPSKKTMLWTIRWAIFCPLMFLAFIYTFTQQFRRLMEPVFSTILLLCGLCLVSMILIAQSEQCYTYTNGLVQVLFFVHAFLKTRFIWRAPTTWILIAIYGGLAFVSRITPTQILVSDLFNLVCINTIGMMAAYIIEYRTRRNFFLSRQLETKKRRLAVANQYLENRVAKRTADLSRTNQLLQDEIHERRAAESALRKSESRFRRMVDNVSDFMCVHDLDGNILDANRQMITGLGYSQSELDKMRLKSLVISDQHFSFEHYIDEIRKNGRSVGQITLRTKTGEQHQFEYSNVLAEHTSGQRVVYSLARDMTQYQQTEKALAESQASFKSMFEISAAGMMIVNAHNRKVVEVNPAAADMVGADIDHIKEMPIDNLICLTQQNGDVVTDITTPYPIECELITRQQTRIPILRTTKVASVFGQAHWIISIVDMQKIKAAEEAKRTVEKRMNQAQHLQSIGTLAGGIAHDFNNILFGMMGFAELALDDAPKDSLQASNLEEILQGGRRAKEMIGQILTLSRQDNAEKNPLQPVPLINEALKLLRASIPATIDIQTRFKDRKKWINANPTQLHQVIMNLSTNAAHAMSAQGGCLKIELDSQNLRSDKVTPHGKIPKGRYVRIRFSDTGTGIPAELQRRLFEPFFTTKPPGEGTGIGLSVTLGIVQSHGGTIQFQSQVGKGSRFDILLPAITVTEKNAEETPAPLSTGNEHILYVDDEKPLTIMMDRMLSGLGYTVTICQIPQQALKLVKEKPYQFDLVITDLTMPHMTGTHLAREMLNIRPDLPILVCTGYGDQLTKEKAESLGICELLIKPVQKAEIATAIRQALAINPHAASSANLSVDKRSILV